MTSPEDQNQQKKRLSRRDRMVRSSFRAFVGSLVALLLVLVALAWYSTTDSFQRRVRDEVVRVLEDATGGRVELAKIHFVFWHLGVQADGLVIHGLEPPTEAPYLSAKRIVMHIRIANLFFRVFRHESHVSLDLLRIEEPQVHLIIDKDGHTNQPIPHRKETTEPVMNTLLDLQAKEVELLRGRFQLNDRIVPFDLAARDLDAHIRYLPVEDWYGVRLVLNDLRTRLRSGDEAQSHLYLDGEIGSNSLEVGRLALATGKDSRLVATGVLRNFSAPTWNATVKGTLSLPQISVLTGFPGFRAGSVGLDVQASGCSSNHGAENIASADCQAGYLFSGTVGLHKTSYEDQFVRLHDVDGGARLHITPTELLLTDVSGYLPGGGAARGTLRISNWLGQSAEQKADSAQARKRGHGSLAHAGYAHALIDATLTKVPLRTIMDVTAPKNYGDLGFDTAATGPVQVEWGGPIQDLARTVEVQGNLDLAPTGHGRPGLRSNVPITGHVLAHYTGKNETVQVQQVTYQTPHSSLRATGVLGVAGGDPLTDLRTELIVHDLTEYDQLLQTLGLAVDGRQGIAAVPVALHGGLEFHGTASGPVENLDVKGHLAASGIDYVPNSHLRIPVDRLTADAEFSPDGGLEIADATLLHGGATLNARGSVRPREVLSPAGKTEFLWDNQIHIDGEAHLKNAEATDLLRLGGWQANVPVTGAFSVDAHAKGTYKDLNGAGTVSLTGGTAYGEAFEAASADLTVRGADIEAPRLVFRLHGMQLTGSGGYDLASQRLHGHLQANRLALSRLDLMQRSAEGVTGTLSFVADANGTWPQPGLRAALQISDVTMQGKALGALTAEMHSEGDRLFLNSQSTLAGANFRLTGETTLGGSFPTQAKLSMTGFDIGRPLQMFSVGDIRASSSIDGVVNLSGPLKNLKALNGEAEFPDLDLKLQGIELRAAEPLRISLKDGLARLDRVHITGHDTDMRASGTAQIFGPREAGAGALNLQAKGSISIALAHTFYPDLISSGRVTFAVAAGGQLRQPALTGNIQFERVNLAVDGVPNGLSNMNGKLVFNQDRLEVKNLTATTGGGQIRIGGFLTYAHGVFANLTATGDVVRVRLYGLSATANTNLKLQGTPQSFLLSGNILLTRFGIGPGTDFAMFSRAQNVSVPPDPNAPSNRIRLDVHVTSSPQLDFQNSYAKLAGTVDLNIRGTVAEPSILGKIQVTEGSATFAGTRYQLQRGDIYFSNPVRIDPVIDLDATARVENYDITVGLHGTMANLKPSYRSEPPLSEADVFALLALGRTQEEAQLYQEQQVQQGTDPTTSTLLGGALNATVSNRVEKLFGVGSVRIDPAFVGTLGNSAARITVQQQISRQVTATFATNVNQTAQQLIQVQYNLTDNKSIVVTRDESGVFSIVYKLRQRYK